VLRVIELFCIIQYPDKVMVLIFPYMFCRWDAMYSGQAASTGTKVLLDVKEIVAWNV